MAKIVPREELTMGKPHWQSAFQQNHATWSSTFHDIQADKKARMGSLKGAAMHTVLGVAASLIPGASLLFDSVTLARIVQHYDPSFRLMHDQTSQKERTAALLAHVENKLLSDKLADRELGSKIATHVDLYASGLRAGKPRVLDRRFINQWASIKKRINRVDPKFLARLKESQHHVAFYTHAAQNKPITPAQQKRKDLAQGSRAAVQSRVTKAGIRAIPQQRTGTG